MNPDSFLPYGRQIIDDEDVAAVTAALRAPLITQGPLVDEFERALAQATGAPHVSVVSNGTVALQLAYAALGLGPGDEIITSPITFAATANAARALGADVRFGDVEPDTGNLRVDSIEPLINERTRGIVPVHFGGLPADLAPIRELATRRGLWVVEDAAHALGGEYRGAVIGGDSYAEAMTFSFHPVKHVTTAEGGAIAVRDVRLKQRIDRLRHHGIERNPEAFTVASPGPWYHEVQELGWNCRLSDIQCALGLSQMKRHAAWLKRRREVADQYRKEIGERLRGVVEPQATRPERTSAYHLFPVLVDFSRVSRREVMEKMRALGIGTQVHYIPVNRQPYYQKLYGPPPHQPGAESFYERELSLPMYAALTERDVTRVVDSLCRALEA